jgi:hypothetical protein
VKPAAQLGSELRSAHARLCQLRPLSSEPSPSRPSSHPQNRNRPCAKDLLVARRRSPVGVGRPARQPTSNRRLARPCRAPPKSSIYLSLAWTVPPTIDIRISLALSYAASSFSSFLPRAHPATPGQAALKSASAVRSRSRSDPSISLSSPPANSDRVLSPCYTARLGLQVLIYPLVDLRQSRSLLVLLCPTHLRIQALKGVLHPVSDW